MRWSIRSWFTRLSETKVGIAMMIFTFAIFFMNSPFLETVSDRLFDLNMKMRGPVSGERDIVIVAIDQKSQDRLGRWPWSRVHTARLIDAVNAHGPKAVGLDIVFSYPEERPDLALAADLIKQAKPGTPLHARLEKTMREADADALLAASISKGPVVPGYFFFTDPAEVKGLELDNEADYRRIKRSRYAMQKLPEGAKPEFPLLTAAGVKSNIDIITAAAPYCGYFNMAPDDDGMLRRAVSVIEFNGKYFPSLDMQTLATYYSEKTKVLFDEAGVAGFLLGEHSIPSDEYGHSVINYYGPGGTFPAVSIADVLDNRDPEKLDLLIKDKIVLVGATAIGIYDLRATPFGIMPGVEVHANFMQNVIDGTVPRRAQWFFAFDALSILLLSLALTLAMRKVKVFMGGLIAFMLALGYVYFQRYMFLEKNTLLNVLYPLLAIGNSYGGIALYKYFVEASEKKYVKKAFEQYLAPAMVNRIMEDPHKLQLGGESRVLTAFFSDIAGFSSFSENMKPADLVELLNAYLTEMSNIILLNNGTLDKYIGDAIVAFYGAPLPYEEHASRACRTALACQKRLKELRTKWAAQNLPPVEVRIGINTGTMLVGNLGSNQRFDYTVMGDEVNLASRLEGINKQYGSYICASEATRLASGDEFEWRELDIIRVVGRKTPVRIYELLALRGELAEPEIHWKSAYETGLASYKMRRWQEARSSFQTALGINNNDKASKALLERCEHFMQHPPESGWDGVYTHTSK